MNNYLAEFLGTVFITYVIFSSGNWIAHGSALAIAVLLLGSISVAAFNPAVTISLYAAGKLQKVDLIPYIIVQILGALTGFYLYNKFVNKNN